MSDEKKGAVPTSEELDDLIRGLLALSEADRRYREAPAETKFMQRAALQHSEATFNGKFLEAAPRLLESARRARIAAELFERHGASILSALDIADDELQGEFGDGEEAEEAGETRKALESTIAAFRKGAE